MHLSSPIQIFFSAISLLFCVNFAVHHLEGGLNGVNLAIGLFGGIILSAFLYGLNVISRQSSFRAFNTTILGFFSGCLMGSAILYILDSILLENTMSQEMLSLRFMVYLISAYFGVLLITRASNELHLSLPFVEFKQSDQKKKDVVVDLSILNDARFIELASTGLLDQQLIFPRFYLKELYTQIELSDESGKVKARRSLEVLKKLESLPSLNLRFVETDFPETKDLMMKLIQLARLLGTDIITSDMNRVQQSSIEGIRIINIHMLSNALKPITQTGEILNIKIQRYGKEARQGVGYLEDGTMVVVNGGAEFIGETIKSSVLSVKHTSSGRMIFCNAVDSAEEYASLNRLDHEERPEEALLSF